MYWGEHFNAEIVSRDPFERINVTYEMSKGFAARLNKKDDAKCYKKGDITSRFESEESAIKTSIKKALELYPKLTYIALGGYARREPRPLVWCVDEDVMKKANIISEKFNQFFRLTNDPWPDNEEEMIALTNQWDKLVDGIGEK